MIVLFTSAEKVFLENSCESSVPHMSLKQFREHPLTIGIFLFFSFHKSFYSVPKKKVIMVQYKLSYLHRTPP